MSDEQKGNEASDLKRGEWPGFINIADVRGNYTGCKAVLLVGDTEMNAYFERNRGRLVERIVYSGDEPVTREDGQVVMQPRYLVVFTKTVSDKELAYLERFGQKVRDEIDKEEADQRASEEESRALQAKQEEEARRLAKVGKTCEEHHARLVEENRDLKKKSKKGHS